MGAVPAAGDLIIVKLKSTVGGEQTINDLSFQINNPAPTWPEQVDQAVLDLNTALAFGPGSVWTVARSTAFNTYAIEVSDARPATSPLLERGMTTGQGELAEDVMPPNDSLCITLRTDVKGRTGRGRLYLNGYSESLANGGYWEFGAQANAGLIAQALMDNFGPSGAGDMTWGVISRFEFGVKRAIPAFTAINSYTVHNEVRSLRRRAVGVRISRHRAVA